MTTNTIIRKRPWVRDDHLSPLEISDAAITGIENDSALKVNLRSECGYILGKRSDGADPDKLMDRVAYPNGWWHPSLHVHDVTVDGVKRTDGKSHTDFLWLDAYLPLQRQASVLLERLTFRNGDGSAMGMLVAAGRFSELVLDSIVMEPTVAQRDVVIKPGVEIDRLILRNCHGFTITPREGGVTIGKVELINSTAQVRVPGVWTVIRADTRPADASERILDAIVRIPAAVADELARRLA